jgi:predicted proteasome-type protease
MRKLHTVARCLAAIVTAGALAASQALASPAWVEDDGAYQTAAADCYSIGEQVAAQHGGTLAKASAKTQGGQTVCVIVVLVPGKDGGRPRRVQVVVPAG